MLPERFETVEEAIHAYLDSIIGPYRKLAEADRKLKRIQKLIDSGKATYSDGHDYAIRCGQLLKSVFGSVFDAADFPDGIFDYDLAKGIFPPAFRQNYEVISSGCSTIQESLNERAGLGIKAQIPEYNQDRAFGIAKKVSSDLFEKTAWVLGEPVINASQSIVDDFIEENAAFHLDAGLKPKIVRSVVGGCCEWCQNLAGTYDYSPDMDRSVFRRHNRCRCTTEYNPGDGRRQDVWTKKWVEQDNTGITASPLGDDPVYITEQAISKVDKVKMKGLEEQSLQIQKQNQELLRFAMSENQSREVSTVIKITELDSKNIVYAKGDWRKSNIHTVPQLSALLNRGSEKSLIWFHNHPNSNLFSYDDL